MKRNTNWFALAVAAALAAGCGSRSDTSSAPEADADAGREITAPAPAAVEPAPTPLGNETPPASGLVAEPGAAAPADDVGGASLQDTSRALTDVVKSMGRVLGVRQPSDDAAGASAAEPAEDGSSKQSGAVLGSIGRALSKGFSEATSTRRDAGEASEQN